ncbi:MAG: hypothetical protein SF162_19895 [bacterium]|nr:hypothetical protein [bacterium]
MPSPVTTTPPSADTLCAYVLREDGIHQFTFKASVPGAIDAWMEQVSGIYAHVTADDTLLFLIDLRESGTLPIAYTFQKARIWLKTLHVHPNVRLAMLHNDEVLISLITTFMDALRLGHLKTATFRRAQAQAAIDWLLQA